MTMASKILQTVVLLAATAVALACGGGKTTINSQNDDVAVTVRLATKGNYSMTAYLLDGSSLTEPGTPVGEASHDGSVWTLKLDPTRSYRIRVASNDIEILDTIVLSSDFANAVNNVLDIKVVNGATTYLTMLAYNKDNSDIGAAWKQVLSEHGISSFDEMKLASASSKFSSNELYDVKLVTIAAGLMTDSSDTSNQDAWDDILAKIATYVEATNGSISGVIEAFGKLETTSLSTSSFDDSVASFLGFSSGSTTELLQSLLADNTTFATSMAKGKAALEGKATVTSSSGNVKRMDLDDAFTHFSAAKSAEPGSSEALFFTAFTRLASMPVRDSSALTKIKDALHLGMTYTNNDDIDYSTTVLVNPSRYTDLPRPEFLEDGVRDVIVKQVEESIAELEAIKFADTSKITLEASMQGDTKASSAVVFDKTDIKAILAWLYFMKAQAHYAMSHDMTLSGKTDTNMNMRQFILDLNDKPLFSGNNTYTVTTATIMSATGSVTPTSGTATLGNFSFAGGFPGELLDLNSGDMRVSAKKNGSYPVSYDYDLTESGLRYDSFLNGTLSADLNTISGNINQGVYNATTKAFLGSRYLSVTASKSSGTLALDTTHNILYSTQFASVIDANSSFATADSGELNAARTALQASISLMNTVLEHLKVNKASGGASRTTNLVDDANDLKRDDGHEFSVHEMTDFQTFLSSMASALNDNGTSLDPRMLDSDLSQGELDLSFAFDSSRPLRYYISNGTSTTTNSKGEVDFYSSRGNALNQNIAGGDDNSNLHFLGQSSSNIRDEIQHAGESVALFVGGLQKPQKVELYQHNGVKFITWEPVGLASGYYVYYSHQVGITPSNYLTLTDPGRVKISGGNAFFATMSGNLNLTDTGNGQHYFIVTAINDITPLVSNGTTRTEGPAYESTPSSTVNDSSIPSVSTSSSLYGKISGRPEFNNN